MKRRSVLGALLGAPIAGKVAASQALTGSVGLALPPSAPIPEFSYRSAEYAERMVEKAPGLTVAAARMMLNTDPDLMAMLHRHIEREIPVRAEHYLDTDLQANRSMSRSAKQIIQRRRMIERRIADVLDGEDPMFGGFRMPKALRAVWNGLSRHEDE